MLEQIVKMYEKERLSIPEIAKKFSTYPNDIRRQLLKAGVKIRNRSETQSIALTKREHPTKGKPRSLAVKLKISQSVGETWDSLPESVKAQRAEKSRQTWNSMTAEEKKDMSEAATKARLVSAKEGSKLEKFLQSYLISKGWQVIFHKTGLVLHDNLEVDLFIPEVKTAIEIDGPTHFLPIWGEESLQRHVSADAHKSGLLLSSGFAIIRVKHLQKTMSQRRLRIVGELVDAKLRELKVKFPDKEDRYIEVDT